MKAFMVRLLTCALVVGSFTAVIHASVIYEEDFEDGIANGITQYGSWSIGTGLNGSTKGFHSSGGHDVLVLDNISSDNIAVDVDFVIGWAQVGDFDIWVNAEIDPGRLDGPVDGGYKVMVNPAASDNPLASLVAFTSTPYTIAEAPNTIIAGRTYHLRLERVGSSLRVLQDGQEILVGTDSAFSSGLIAFRLYGGGIVDNIQVSQIPEPGSLSLLALGTLVLFRRKH